VLTHPAVRFAPQLADEMLVAVGAKMNPGRFTASPVVRRYHECPIPSGNKRQRLALDWTRDGGADGPPFVSRLPDRWRCCRSCGAGGSCLTSGFGRADAGRCGTRRGVRKEGRRRQGPGRWLEGSRLARSRSSQGLVHRPPASPRLGQTLVWTSAAPEVAAGAPRLHPALAAGDELLDELNRHHQPRH
jgi:hypothetical protein